MQETESLPLKELKTRLKVVADRVRGVALRQQHGFYLHGRPGTSKTYTVRKTLDEMGTPYAYQAGHLTDLGLFDLLNENANRIVLLDDVSQIFKHKIAMQIFLAALGNQEQRIVTYRRRNLVQSFEFKGGIIAISNLEIHGDGVMEALKSRVQYTKYDPTEEQLEALMIEIANGGWKGLMTVEECHEVTDFLIAESHRLSVRLDMRNLVDKAFPDYLQWRERLAETHWKDLVTTTLEEQLIQLQHTPEIVGRDANKRKEQIIARSIDSNFPDRRTKIAKWQESTGKSERAFYRRLAEVD